MKLDRRYLLMIAVGLFILLVVVYPLWQVVFRSFLDAGLFSLKSYRKVFAYPTYYRALLNSVWISCATGAFCMVSGTLLAFLVVRTDLPGKNFLRTLLVLPYALPSFFLPSPGSSFWDRKDIWRDSFLSFRVRRPRLGISIARAASSLF